MPTTDRQHRMSTWMFKRHLKLNRPKTKLKICLERALSPFKWAAHTFRSNPWPLSFHTPHAIISKNLQNLARIGPNHSLFHELLQQPPTWSLCFYPCPCKTYFLQQQPEWFFLSINEVMSLHWPKLSPKSFHMTKDLTLSISYQSFSFSFCSASLASLLFFKQTSQAPTSGSSLLSPFLSCPQAPLFLRVPI